MKRLPLLILASLLAAAFVPRSLNAAEIAGVTLDDSIQAGGADLILTGMGLRTKTFLKVKVYAAGLYMENPVLKADEIIRSDQSKAFVMDFLYKEVEGEKLQEAWREGFEANTPSADPDLKKRMERFVSLFTASAVKGDRYIFTYTPGTGTTVTFGSRVVATIPGADFARALMAVWFGEKPGDGGLRALKKSILEGMQVR